MSMSEDEWLDVIDPYWYQPRFGFVRCDPAKLPNIVPLVGLHRYPTHPRRELAALAETHRTERARRKAEAFARRQPKPHPQGAAP